MLSYPLLTLSSHLLLSTTLPSPLHYSTLPTPFLTLSCHLLYFPTISSPPFIPQLTYPTLQSPLPNPLIFSPASPRLLYLPYCTLPPLPYSPFYYPSLKSPTYLPSHPYHTLAFPTLRSPHTRPLASPPLSSPIHPVPYPTISLRTLTSLPYYTLPSTIPLHLSYLPTLTPLSYPCIPYPPLSSHPLPSHPLPCPLPCPIISLRTGLGSETFPSLLL